MNIRKKILYVLYTLIAFLSIVCVFAFKTFAFGDYNDYSYDSGSSYSSDSWSSSGSDFYYSGSDGGSSYSGGSSERFYFTFVFFLITIIPAIFIYVIVKSIQNKNGTSDNRNGKRRQAPLSKVDIPNRNIEITQIIKENDINFDTHDFILEAKNIYRLMQNSWCAKDLTPLMECMDKNLYETSNKQILLKKEQGITQVLKNLKVNDAYLTCYKRDTEYEYVRVYINSSMIDYQTEDATGRIVYGDTETVWTMRYDMTFKRALGMTTSAKENTKLICPNCGAEVDGTSFGVCNSCGSAVSNGNHGWVVSDFTAIKDYFRDTGIQK